MNSFCKRRDLRKASSIVCFCWNADEKKPMVQQARLFFLNTVSTGELIRNSVGSNILFYKTAQGETRIEVIFNGDTFWMSQKRMADLFGVDVRTVRGCNYPKNWDSSV